MEMAARLCFLILILITFCASNAQAIIEDNYRYLILRAISFIEFRSRYVDTFEDPQGQYFNIDPGSYSRLYLKFRSSSGATQFFRQGTPYTWRGPSKITPQGLRGYYGHYVIESLLSPSEARRNYPGACWEDITRSQGETQSGLYYLRGAHFIYNAVPWNFSYWETSTPDHPRRWYWHGVPTPSNAMDLELRKMRSVDIAVAIGSKLEAQLKKEDRRFVQAKTFMQQYGEIIERAARKFDLHPEVVAAIIITEQRDQKSEIPAYIFGGYYVGSYSPENLKALGGAFGSILGRDASIGLGQIRTKTAKGNNLGGVGHLSRPLIAKKLLDPEFNIFATAQYIRIIAEKGSRYKKADYTKLFSSESENRKYMMPVNLSDFAKHSLEWKAGHIILLGSEYTSTMWDGRYKPDWGLRVFRAYKDVLEWDECEAK